MMDCRTCKRASPRPQCCVTCPSHTRECNEEAKAEAERFCAETGLNIMLVKKQKPTLDLSRYLK